MCGVFGFLRMGSDVLAAPLKIEGRLHSLAAAAESRGRDSWGLVAIDDTGHAIARKEVGRFRDASEPLGWLTPQCRVVLGCTRAEPTTEYVKNKTKRDIGPFVAQGHVVAHNGTVANDHELSATLGFTPTTSVDSGVLPHLCCLFGVEEALARVQGSFAVAAVDLAHPHRLSLVRNYKPLAYQYDPKGNVVWFASLPEWLDEPGSRYRLDAPRTIIPEPYTHVLIDGLTREVEVRHLQSRSSRPRRVVVAASGGLDSTVAAALLLREGCHVHLLHMDYACHASTPEAKAVLAIASALGVEATCLDLGWLGQLGGSTLTEAGRPIAKGAAGAEFAHEWVPARNMVMIANACAFADARGYDAIALGTNLEEGGAFSDNTQEFARAMDMASHLGTRVRARVISPVGDLMKHEIVRLGLDILAPLALTWSCYSANHLHCGHCGPCFMRRAAFRINGEPDPIRYLDEAEFGSRSSA